ncbi:MAG: fibronectin type III domain-containing protein [Solirubrobacterales bacterium]
MRLVFVVLSFVLALALAGSADAKSSHRKHSRLSEKRSAFSASITTPANGSTVSGSIAWTASASSSAGIRSVRFYVDGALKVTDTISPYTYRLDSGAFNTANYGNGPHVLKIVATNGNNSTKTDSHTVTVYNAPPASAPPPPPVSQGDPSGPTTTPPSTPPPPDVTAPSAPTGLSASAVTTTGAKVAWLASTDNVGVDHYDVSVGGAKQGSTRELFYNVSLACGTTSTVTVTAFDSAGNSATGAVNVTSSACPDLSAPSAPSGVTAASVTKTSATLSWTASTDNVGVHHYDVYKDGALHKTVTGATSAAVTLACDVTSSFTVKAVDAAGNASAASAAKSVTGATCADTTPPSIPGNAKVSSITQTSAVLSWDASTDDVELASYDLYRDGAWIDWSMNSPYTYNGLTCGTSYSVQVIALDRADNLGVAAPVSFTTAACAGDNSPPSAPSGLTASSVTQTGANLSWTASSDNLGVDHYELSKDGAFVKNVSGTTTSVALSCGVTSSFTVTAKDAAGNAATSAAKTIAGAACSVPGDSTKPSAPSGLTSSNITQTGATLSWTASTDNVGVDHYVVYKDAVNAGQTSGASYSVALTCGVQSTFTVAAFDAAGNSATSAGLNITGAACPAGGGPTPPSVPGTWTLNFSDEFNGSGLDATKWCSSWFNGGSMNNVTTSPSNVSVTGGNLVLNQSSSSVGSLVNSNPSDCGSKGYAFTTGYYAEASVYFPGSGTSMNNWPAWWTNGQSWPANGEIDIAEGLGSMSSNYHSPSGANNYMVSGVWTNAYHTYAVLREAGKNTIYFDGKLIRSYNTDDGGAPEYLIFNQGGSGSTGAASQVKVDWVRVWKK